MHKIPRKYNITAILVVSVLMFLAVLLLVLGLVTNDKGFYEFALLPVIAGALTAIVYLISRPFIKRGTW